MDAKNIKRAIERKTGIPAKTIQLIESGPVDGSLTVGWERVIFNYTHNAEECVARCDVKQFGKRGRCEAVNYEFIGGPGYGGR